MARVELATAAAQDLERVKRSVRPLARLPLLGASLEARWSQLHFVLGPWRWMLIVYEYLEEEDRVVVVTIQDGRSPTAPTTSA